MSRTVDAIYENGVFTPEQPVELAEKTKVHLVIEKVAPAPAVEDDDPSGWKTIDSLRGIIKDAPPDTAENHDKVPLRCPRRVIFLDTSFLLPS